MNQSATTQTGNRSVTADIGYAVDTGTKPVNETFEAGQIIRRRTGETEQRSMRIRDGRPLAAEFSLDRNGFAFVDHKTAVADFFDPAQLETVYYPEVQRLIQAVSGASRVVVFDHTLRTGDRCCGRTMTIRNGLARSASARSCPTRPNNCCSTASRSFRCGGRSTSRFSRIRSRSPMHAV
jgi:hypothetical protein